jgi:hypothetical protein
MSVKTLAVRIDSQLHGQLTLLCRLRDITVTEAIRTAIRKEVAIMADDPAVAAKARELQAEITREADEQRAALAALLGTDSPSAGKTAPRKSTTAPKRSS